MAREDENDLGIDLEFFRSRGKVKNPRPQKRSPKPPTDNPELPDIVKNVKPKSRWGNAYQHTKTGAREDLGGIVARSGWESNVMRILLLYKIPFQFEPTVFPFPPDARGRLQAYLPDIYLPETDEYIEVKGMLDGRGRNKLRKFKKHYPDEFSRLTVVISKSNKPNKFFFTKLGVKNIIYMEHLIKLYADKIVAWEGKKK